MSKGSFPPALPRTAGGAGKGCGDAIYQASRPARYLPTKCLQGRQEPKAVKFMKRKGREGRFSPPKAIISLIIKQITNPMDI
jgi:hypothetical protein